MARIQVVDGGTASNMEGSCEYIELVVADSGHGLVLQVGFGRSSNNSSPKKVSYYEMFTQKASDMD
jgi:hypothetical protein